MSKRDRTRTIGIIANPYSSRDIRRVVSCANAIQTSERANIVVRVIAAISHFGIERVVLMPDRSGLCGQIIRSLKSCSKNQKQPLPKIDFIDMPITETIADTEQAAAYFHDLNVDCVVVLGGDGTHRAVAKKIGEIPIAGISTGTNNAFPEFNEATLVGMAIGLYVDERIPDEVVVRNNKKIKVFINGEYRDIAIVDVAITTDLWVGSKALWRMHDLQEIYLAFCEPNAIGMSAIGGLISPKKRSDKTGLKIKLLPEDKTVDQLIVPVAPGMFESVGIQNYADLEAETPHVISTRAGVVALDGEREIEFDQSEEVSISLSLDGPCSIAVPEAINYAAEKGVFLQRASL